jgi:hypothetical protein
LTTSKQKTDRGLLLLKIEIKETTNLVYIVDRGHHIGFDLGRIVIIPVPIIIHGSNPLNELTLFARGSINNQGNESIKIQTSTKD